MLDQQWLIGSAEDCDLLIDAPTVSAHHCRLTRIGKQYFLEDCGSTNGTYCDGAPITSKTAVQPSATITLGRSFPCPWPDSAGAKQIVFVGRDRENDFWLDRPNVSSLHARFMVGRGGSWVVEDLDSTNGVSVNLRGVRHRIRKAVSVQPEQTVYFGSTPVDVTALIETAARLKSRPLPGAAAASEAAAAGGLRAAVDEPLAAGSPLTTEQAAMARLAAAAPPHQEPFTLHGPRMALWFAVGALLAVGLFMMLSLFGERLKQSLSGPAGDVSQPAAGHFPTPPGPLATPVATVPQPSAAPSSPFMPPAIPPQPSPLPAQGTANAAAAAAPAPDTTGARGLFWVLACDAGGEPAFRLGMACTVDGRHLLTTASVVEALRSLAAQGYTVQQVVHCQSHRRIAIRSSGVHPLFAQWLARSRSLEQRYFQLRDQAQTAAQQSTDGLLSPALEESADAGVPSPHPQLAAQMKQLAHEEIALRDRMLCYDAGWLAIPPEASLQAWRQGPLAPQLARPLQSIRLTLAVIDAEDPYYDPTADPLLQTFVGRVHRLVRPPDTAIGRMEIKLSTSLAGWNTTGAPILDSSGRVLGLYTQPSVPQEEPDNQPDEGAPDSAAAFNQARGDVVLASVLEEVLQAAQSSQE